MYGILVLVLVAAMARPAIACTIIGDRRFSPGPTTESTPPSAVRVGWIAFLRVADPDEGCTGASGSTCSGATFVEIEVAASDDTTPSDQVGYQLRVVSGTSPSLELYDRIPYGNTIQLRGSDPDEDLDFELGISALDASGNIGPETTVRITSEAGGCRIVGHSGVWSLLWIGAAIVLALRRRR